jgi:hypothetical protein
MAIGKKTGGRTKGTPNQASVRHKDLARRAVHMVLDTGIVPLDIMSARMRDEPLPNGRRVTDEMFAAAVAAAPYIHPRLAVQVTKNLDPKANTASAIEDRVMALLTKGTENAQVDAGRTLEGTEWSDVGGQEGAA